MPAFKFTELTTSPAELDIVSAALGDTPDNKATTDADIGKLVKLGGFHNYVLCAAGDEIEGRIDTVRGDSVNEGYSFGGVQRRKRFTAVIGAGQGETPAKVLDYVVADAQAALGTAEVGGVSKVKTGAPTRYLWRILEIDGNGLEGSSVLLERQ